MGVPRSGTGDGKLRDFISICPPPPRLLARRLRRDACRTPTDRILKLQIPSPRPFRERVSRVAGRVRGGLSAVIPTTRLRELRCTETQAERAAWQLLRARRTGLKFHRQYRIGKFAVDFYCCELRLAIELDGSVHSQPSIMRKDAAKDQYLKSIGIRVLRIPNGMVLEDPEKFVSRIRSVS